MSYALLVTCQVVWSECTHFSDILLTQLYWLGWAAFQKTRGTARVDLMRPTCAGTSISLSQLPVAGSLGKKTVHFTKVVCHLLLGTCTAIAVHVAFVPYC